MLEKILDAFGVREDRHLDDAPELDAEYQVALAKWLVSKLPLIYLGNGTAMFGLVFGLFWFVEPAPIILWAMVAMGHIILCRLYTWQPSHAEIHLPKQASFWARYLEWSSITQGVIWGAGAWYFLQGAQPLQLAWVMFALTSTVACAIPLMASHPRAYMMFAVLTGIGVVSGLLGHGIFEFVMASFFSVFVGISILLSLGTHRTLSSALHVSIEHAWLADSLREQKEIAEKAVEDKSRFLAAASHDLRQPLSALLLFSEALSSTPGKSSSEVSEGIGRATRSLKLLMDALMDVSRLDSGNHQPQLQAVSVDEMFKELNDACMPFADDKGLKLEFDNSDEWVQADPVFLRRMLGNLIENAIRYTDVGEVKVGVKKDQGKLKFSVQDTGPGIAESDQAKIFEEFRQLEGAERKSKRGLGLGLSIVQRLAALCDTEIELSSEVGVGSCFAFALPVAQAQETPADAEVANVQKLEVPVLVLENDPEVAKAMQMQLERFGCSVRTAASANAAKRIVESSDFAPDVILTDYRLDEDSTGVEAIAAVRKSLSQNVPAAIISGDRAAEKQEVIDSGLRVLQKPLGAAQLRLVVNSLLKDQPSNPNSRAA